MSADNVVCQLCTEVCCPSEFLASETKREARFYAVFVSILIFIPTVMAVVLLCADPTAHPTKVIQVRGRIGLGAAKNREQRSRLGRGDSAGHHPIFQSMSFYTEKERNETSTPVTHLNSDRKHPRFLKGYSFPSSSPLSPFKKRFVLRRRP